MWTQVHALLFKHNNDIIPVCPTESECIGGLSAVNIG